MKKITFLALFAAIALAIFVIELQIPPLTPIYGVKLGLANIVTLFILTLGGKWKCYDAFAVTIVRTVLGAFVTGHLMTLLFSFFGAVFALFFMLISRKIFPKTFIPIISLFGAIGHNLGQISIALIIYGTTSVLYYLPILLISGIISGIITGFCVYYIFKTHKRFINIFN